MKSILSRLCKSKFIVAILAVLIMAVGSAAPVLAYSYYASFTVTETGAIDYDMFAATVTIDNAALATSGYMLASGLDTRILKGSSALPHMVASDRTLFALPVAASSTQNVDYTMGNAILDAFYIITGYSGYITVSDHADIELGDTFYLWMSGWIDVSGGANRDIWFKDSSARFQNDVAGQLSFTITGGATSTAVGLTSGDMVVEVIGDGTNIRIYVDGVLKDTDAIGGVPAPDNANDIILLRNNVAPYGVYVKLWTR